MITHVYRIAISKPDKEKQKFKIEQDIVKVEKKLTQEDIDLMSKENEADVYVIYLGELKEPLDDDLVHIASNYFTGKKLKQIKKDWSKENGTSNTENLQ